MSDLFDENEFVFHKKGDTIQSAGFSINSNFLKNDKTLINQTGGNSNGLNVSDLFKNLAVPSGLFYSNKTGGSKKTTEIITDEVISNDIHDNLKRMMGLHSVDSESDSESDSDSEPDSEPESDSEN